MYSSSQTAYRRISPEILGQVLKKKSFEKKSFEKKRVFKKRVFKKRVFLTIFKSPNSCLNAYFVMKRNVGYYLFHCFIPSLLCVIISWLSFWIEVDIAPARVTFGIATTPVFIRRTHVCTTNLGKW